MTVHYTYVAHTQHALMVKKKIGILY